MDKTIDKQLKYGEQLKYEKQLKYGRFFIKSYNVNYNDNSMLMATENTYENPIIESKEKDDEEFDFINYIKALYSKTIKGTQIKVFNEPNLIEYDEDYLIVIENDYYSLIKRVFDLRNIELPEKTKQEIKEIKDYLESNKKTLSISKYLPFINGIIYNKTIPLIKEDDVNNFKLLYENTIDASNEKRYLRDRDKMTYIGRYDLISTYIILDILAINKDIANFYNEHYIATIASMVGLWICLDILYEKIGKKIINKNVKNDFKDYLELCHKIASGDKESIKSLTEEIGRISTYNNINNSELYLTLVRDLTILDCYKDESLTPIKIELISLGCEYIEYRSLSSEKEIIEELFMKKLKAIEEKVDLTNKKIENKDNDTMNFIATHCDFDEENHLRLIPVVSIQNNKIYKKEI
ncbi:MAG: hypothetical protein VZS44_09245 [Bacilli bacterium]|nr:hypothetical protein [Bacilli bacterium]